MSIEIAIFSAMPEELVFVKEKLRLCKSCSAQMGVFKFDIFDYRQKKILLACTGIGTTFAASLLSLIHQKFSPKYVFLLGTAGGIKNELNVRDVIIVKKAFEAEIQGIFSALKGTPFETCLNHPLKNQQFPAIYAADKGLLDLASILINNKNIHMGTSASSNFFPAPKELFARIRHKDAYSIDMETSAFYQIAWLLGIRILAIRGISNMLNSDGSDDDLTGSDIPGSMLAATNALWTIVDTLAVDSSHCVIDEKLNSPPIPLSKLRV